jgi:transcriptional activator of cad operon
MTAAATARLRIGAWCVDPRASQISRDGETVRVEARTMRLLTCLAERAGETLSVDDLLDAVWPRVTVSPDSVYQAVAQLRRLLGDDPKAPRYIVTVPRLGYRMVAEVAPWADAAGRGERGPRPWVVAIGLAAPVLLAGGWWIYGRAVSDPPAPAAAAAAAAPASIAVMPFLDLTDAMDEEPFADGIAEELADQLSRAGLRVAAPRAAFAFKGKAASSAEVSRALAVDYVLDGSVRKSVARVRVAARLVRGRDSVVVWSQSYDRPAADLLWVQEDIAGEVAAALSGRSLPR